MRLLNKKTLELEWFIDEQVPPYSILSHRWRGAETTLQEFEAQKRSDEQSPGTAKVLRFCREAEAYDADYVWIDTVCIDKSSSAELQEAINSMYRWYELADLCVVYLDDVPVNEATGGQSAKDHLSKSEWFTRGWCLQELLAPRLQKFVDRDWSLIGDREELGQVIEEITGVRQCFFGDSARIRSATVAERMSWMGSRQTSRSEDMAYCMLGLFDVNITMLYGEGSKAFLRLQREIIQSIDDESIFMWLQPKGLPQGELKGLAPSPACYSACRNRQIEKDVYFHREPLRTTTRGVEVELYGLQLQQFDEEKDLFLNCLLDGERAYVPLIRGAPSDFDVNLWRRKPIEELVSREARSVPKPPTTKSAWDGEIHRLEESLSRSDFDEAVYGKDKRRDARVSNYSKRDGDLRRFRATEIRYKISIY